LVKIGDIELNDFPLLLAPMEDVSDPPFRALCKEQGADVVYTEFISSEGLIRDAAKSVKKLDIYEKERPVGIQIFGANLDSMLQTVEIVEQSNPDIIDINFGCPVKKVVSKGAGAGILKDIDKMVKLTEAMVKHTNLPITVKTRLGWDHDTIKIVEVAERLQDVGCKAIAIHGRTRAQMYKGAADWTHIAEVKNNQRMHIPVFGNGDVNTPERAVEMRDQYGLDGAMIGRASIGNPWFFRQVKHFIETGEHLPEISIADRVAMARRHLQMEIDWKEVEIVGVMETRRHYTNYFKAIPHFKEYRLKMVTSDSAADVFDVFDEVLEKFS
jgi:nifR3 family TIM-barrel protein